jgi:hypothetical protein
MKTPKPQYVGTFIKASGEARTMRFATSEGNIRSGGLITVFDVENRGLRKFNLARSWAGCRPSRRTASSLFAPNLYVVCV